MPICEWCREEGETTPHEPWNVPGVFNLCVSCIKHDTEVRMLDQEWQAQELNFLER